MRQIVQGLIACGACVLLLGAAAPEVSPGDGIRGLGPLPAGTAWFSPDVLAQDLGLLPPRLTPANAQFLLGRSLFQQGKYAEAALALRAAIPGLEPIALYGRHALGEALFWGGQPGEAAGVFEAVALADPGGPLAEPARFRTADSLLRARRPAEALVRYRDLSRTASSALRRALAEYLAAVAILQVAGEAKNACKELQQFWLAHPEHFAARSAGRAMRRLRREGSCGPEPTGVERLARAERLFAAGKAKRARQAVERAIPLLTNGAQLQARYLRARAAAALRDDGPAMRDLSAILVAPTADTLLKNEARFELARLASRAGDLVAAGDHYRALAQEAAGSPLGQEASFLWAWTAFNGGDTAEATRRFSAVLADKSVGPRADEARWFLGWNLYRAGKRVESAREFEEVARISPEQRAKALYWKARALGATGEAQALYREVATADAPSWYGLLARARLDELGAAAALEGAPALVLPEMSLFPPLAEPEVAPPPQDPRVDRASLLIALGLPALAQGEILALEQELKSRRAPLEPLLTLFERAGLHHRALLLAETAFAGRIFGPAADRRFAARAYPVAWAPEVSEAALCNGVDPYLLLSLMKRESAFRPWVRSPARAEGLLQVLPGTARKILRIHGLSAPRPGALHEPALNIPLGAWYFAELLGRYGNNPAVAAAAYNAGPRAVDGWLARYGNIQVDEFVEQIPYRETRFYVRSVMSNYAAYRALYGGADRVGISLAAIGAPKNGVRF